MLTHPCQELYRLGILFDDDDFESNANGVTQALPEQPPPTFVIRPGRLRPSRRRSTWRSLQLHLSLSDLRGDTDISRLMSQPDPSPTIQHRSTNKCTLPTSVSFPSPMNGTPLSLPPIPTSALQSSSHNSSSEWTFINIPTPSQDPNPPSEPETWILLSDD